MVERWSAHATREIAVPTGDDEARGDLTMVDAAAGLVVFAHGSGSSRRSSRNRAVAASLQRAGFATLLMDLLTPAEERVDERTREHRFDIPLLASRVEAAIDWVEHTPDVGRLAIGLFGASTGAAAALVAAANRPRAARAVISRGGRPDLAGEALPHVQAPTLLIVGSLDDEVLELNRRAMQAMRAPARLDVVEGASHLFEQPGTLEEVVRLTIDWLERALD
jgi:putative phosphoribosyl transferase